MLGLKMGMSLPLYRKGNLNK